MTHAQSLALTECIEALIVTAKLPATPDNVTRLIAAEDKLRATVDLMIRRGRLYCHNPITT